MLYILIIISHEIKKEAFKVKIAKVFFFFLVFTILTFHDKSYDLSYVVH